MLNDFRVSLVPTCQHISGSIENEIRLGIVKNIKLFQKWYWILFVLNPFVASFWFLTVLFNYRSEFTIAQVCPCYFNKPEQLKQALLFIQLLVLGDNLTKIKILQKLHLFSVYRIIISFFESAYFEDQYFGEGNKPDSMSNFHYFLAYMELNIYLCITNQLNIKQWEHLKQSAK